MVKPIVTLGGIKHPREDCPSIHAGKIKEELLVKSQIHSSMSVTSSILVVRDQSILFRQFHNKLPEPLVVHVVVSIKQHDSPHLLNIVDSWFLEDGDICDSLPRFG